MKGEKKEQKKKKKNRKGQGKNERCQSDLTKKVVEKENRQNNKKKNV